ncbi:OLC1v1028104C2 [Oldenlandia corymbosa var. corymbosa]|nr:OLC1v1028104C2 [Oldenlandia corymbosa var. corymbosa]
MAAASTDDIKLIGVRASPYVNRVQFALNLKSINYELLVENLADKSEFLLKSNPIHKKVPVLIHGDKPICESLAIVEYIDEAFPEGPSILPSDPYDRATARFWAAYIDEKWFPMVLRWLTDSKEEEFKRAPVLEKLTEGVILMEDALVKSSYNNGKGFFGGNSPGYLDIVLGCHLAWLKVVEIDSSTKLLDETKAPALAEWAERIKSHEAVKGTLPTTEELFNLLRKSQQAQAASKASN